MVKKMNKNFKNHLKELIVTKVTIMISYIQLYIII